jgi:hypothetical protein
MQLKTIKTAVTYFMMEENVLTKPQGLAERSFEYHAGTMKQAATSERWSRSDSLVIYYVL